MVDYKEDFWKGKKKDLDLLGFGFAHDMIYKRAGILRAKDQYEWMLGDDKAFSDDLCVLDIGSGYGGAIRVWKKKGFNITGVEPDTERMLDINMSLRCPLVRSGSFLQMSNEKFDLLLLSHVLEHFKDVEQFFNKADKMLGPGGFVFVEVPCCENPVVDMISKSNPAHVYHFNKEELTSLFENHNYEIIDSETFISRIDQVTLPGLSKIERFWKILVALLARKKSYYCKSCGADVIRLLARKVK